MSDIFIKINIGFNLKENAEWFVFIQDIQHKNPLKLLNLTLLLFHLQVTWFTFQHGLKQTQLNFQI